MKKIKIGSVVQVSHEKYPFTGVVEGVITYTDNSFEYIVRADDDKKRYNCPANIVSLK